MPPKPRQPKPKDAELGAGPELAYGLATRGDKREEFAETVAGLRAALDAAAAAFDAEHGTDRARVEQAALNRLMDGTAAARAGEIKRWAEERMPKGEDGAS